MSETSESYHIRTSDPAAAIKTLRSNRFTGLVFRSDAGWLTFVPYGDGGPLPGAFLDGLIRHLDAPVLWYFYAEDFGWEVRVAAPGQDLTRYSVQWDQEPEGDGPDDMLAAMEAFQLESGQLDAINAVFTSANVADFDAPPAYRLAEALKLPAYKWLSPSYVTRETDDYVALGGRKVGRKPKEDPLAIPAPANRKVKLPDKGLTAREAFALIDPIMTEFGDEWFLYRLSGCVGRDGYPPEGIWVWDLSYTTPDIDQDIRIVLHSGGQLSFEGNRFPERPPDEDEDFELPELVGFSEDWIDSPQLMSILAKDTTANGVVMPEHMQVSLSQIYERSPPDLIWEADWAVDADDTPGTSQFHVYLTDAISGVVGGDQVQYFADYDLVDEVLNSRNA